MADSTGTKGGRYFREICKSHIGKMLGMRIFFAAGEILDFWAINAAIFGSSISAKTVLNDCDGFVSTVRSWMQKRVSK
jgi:hypothetical protein